jgi:hypothetical protein
MSDPLRKNLIRLAATMPKESSERKALLDVLAADIEYAGSATEQQKGRLVAEMEKHIRGAGKIIYVRMTDPTKDGSYWSVVFDTEYAALKAYYVYRNSPKIRFGKSPNMNGWFISVGG